MPSKEEEATASAALQLILDIVPYDDALVSKLLVGLGHSKPTPQVGVLKGLVEASERIGSDFAVAISTEYLVKFIVKLIHAASGLVRDATGPALTALYRFSPEFVGDIVALPAFKLTRAELESLKKMFAVADEEGEIVGRRTKAYETSLQIQEGSDNNTGFGGPSPSSSSTSLHESSGSVGSGSGSGGMSRSSSIPNLAAGVKAVNFGSDDDLKKDLANMATQFGKLGPNAWEERVTLLKRFQGLIVGGACKSQRAMLDALVPAYITVFKGLLPMPRAQISDETTKSLSILAQNGGASFASFFDKIIKILLDKLHSTNGILVDQGNNCILNILRFATPNIGALLADRAATSQHMSTRAHCMLYVQYLIAEGSDNYVEKWADAFSASIKAGAADSHESVRSNARRTFVGYYKRWPDRGARLWESLDSSAKSTMKKEGLAPNLEDLPKDSIFGGNHSRNNSQSGGLRLNSSTSSLNIVTSDSSPLKLPELSNSITLPVNGTGSSYGSTGYASSAPNGLPQNHSSSTLTGASRTSQSTSASSHGPSMNAKRTVSAGGTSSSLASRTLTAKTTGGGATRVVNSHGPSNPPAPVGNRAVRVPPKNTSSLSTEPITQQTPRKLASVSTFDSAKKPAGPPSSINKAHSAGGLAGRATLHTTKPTPSSSDASSSASPSKPGESAVEVTFVSPTYTKESADTSEYRNILKRCAVTDLEERTRAMNELREMIYSDSLPTLWSAAETVKTLCTALVPRLLDSQRILTDSLDIVWLMRHERPQSLEQNLELLAPSLFLVSHSVIAKKVHHNTALAILNYLATVEVNRFMTSALKAIENVDSKMKLSTIRCLAYVFAHATEQIMAYFEKSTKRIETFIKWIAIKPHAISSSIDSTRAVTECFGLLYTHLGEAFAAHLRATKFTGQDTVLKKLKISATAPKVAPAPKRTAVAPAPAPAPVKKVGEPEGMSHAAPSIAYPPSGPSIHAKPVETLAKDDIQAKSAQKPRPGLVRQKSLTSLPSDARPRLAMSLEEANAEHAKNMMESQESGDADSNGERGRFAPVPLSLPPMTPSADRVREMRMEIAQTPNVLATVMSQATIISPLTPSLRHGTPSFGARGRSTSTPQMKSFKMSGREVDLQACGIESSAEVIAASPFSPVKFKLDSADSSSSLLASSAAGLNGETDLRCVRNNVTPLLAKIKTIETHVAEKRWEETRTKMTEMSAVIAEISTDILLVAIHEERLLELLQSSLDRNIPAALVRQAACKLLTNIKHKLPARDWDPLFAAFPPAQQKLITRFMEMATAR